jgi:hypothetical protein
MLGLLFGSGRAVIAAADGNEKTRQRSRHIVRGGLQITPSPPPMLLSPLLFSMVMKRPPPSAARQRATGQRRSLAEHRRIFLWVRKGVGNRLVDCRFNKKKHRYQIPHKNIIKIRTTEHARFSQKDIYQLSKAENIK